MTASFPALLGVVPIDVTSYGIRMTENGVTQTVQLTGGNYFLRGDGAADDLCLAVKTALDSHSGGTNVYAVTPTFSTDPASPTCSVSISIASGGPNAFSILWADALTTFDQGLLGFADANTASDANAKTSTLSPSCLWVSNDLYRELEPAPSYRRKVTRARSGKVRAVLRAGDYRDRIWTQEFVQEKRMHEEAITADPTRAFSRFVERHGDGKRFQFHGASLSSGTTLAALTSSTLLGTFHFDDDFYPEDGGRFAARESGAPLYSFSGRLLPYVA